MRAHPRHRDRGARHPRRRADAVAREPQDDGAPHPRMAGRHRHGPPPVRLSSRSPLHRRPDGRLGGRRRGAVLRARHAADAAEPGLHATTPTASRIPSRSRRAIVVGIDAVADKKWQCVSAMPSQFGDEDSWQGRTLPNVPTGDRERAAYLLDIVKKRSLAVADQYRERLVALYGAERGKAVHTPKRSSSGSTAARRRPTSSRGCSGSNDRQLSLMARSAR